MSQALLSRAGLLFFCRRSSLARSSRHGFRWRDISAQHCRNLFRNRRMKTLSQISLMCLGVRYLPSRAQCQGPCQEQALEASTASQGHLRSHDGFLRKITFIVRLGIRFCVLILKFGPLLLVYPLTFLSARLGSLWLHLLLKATESSGPACIKLGQWASTRRDLFSEEFCAKFSKLHVQVSPHPWGYTELCLRRAFGDNYGRVLRFPSLEPVGSGCVAQVYKAYADLSALDNMETQTAVGGSERGPGFEAWEVSGLRRIFGWLWKQRKIDHVAQEHSKITEGASDIQPGDDQILLSTQGSEEQPQHLVPVAVKVLHPGLRQQVEMDLLLMKIWSQLLGLIPGFRWLSLTEIVEEFEKLMTQQIDLNYEARNLEHFHQKFEKIDFIKFPTPLRPFVTRNILVESFEEGEPLTAYLQDPEPSLIKKSIANIGMDMLLKMVFVDNFVHADLHPGNILIQGAEQFHSGHPDQTTLVDMCDTLIVILRPSRCPLRLVLLDAGIVAELQEKDLENFRAVFTAVLLGQGETVAELILHHARASHCIDVEAYKSEMAVLVNEARKNTITLGKLQIAGLLSRVFRLLMKHKVKLESNFASIIFAILVLEGLSRSLDPETDLLEAARPLLVKSAASLL